LDLFPYSVDNAWFSEAAARHRKNRAALRAELGLSAGDFVVLGVMKWHEREDPLTLLEAFSALCKSAPRARLVMVGDGPLRAEVGDKLQQLGSKAVFPGYVAYSELPKYYAIGDVFVHPAVDEPWGVSVNEAMACGLPVVAAEGVGAAADLLADGQAGYIFPNRNSELLAEQLAALGENTLQLKRMGHNALLRISAWSYQKTFEAMQHALGCESA
jgi:glycosyltransferase involved in cell wall biosynthesis